MEIEFDPAKDAANVAKHGISLARAGEMDDIIVVPDQRFAESRYRLYGWIDGLPYCAAVTRRGPRLRIISLRRAHAKEFKRHAH